MFGPKQRIHFIGIGGIGTSAIAQLLYARGCQISGSDLKASALIEKLQNMGMQIFIGHHGSHAQGADLVIYSAAVKKDNPELLAASAQGIPVLSRAQALAFLANEKKSIAVTGAHGKTTTTSLIAHMLVSCGIQPTVCAGGEIFNLNGNAVQGQGRYFVLEADESDGSFLTLNPIYAVVTNIDKEHLDYYRNLEHIHDTFRKFINQTKKEGCVFFCWDDPALNKIARSLDKRFFSFGLHDQADIFAAQIDLQNNLSRFDCIYKGKNLGEVFLQIPGRHNVSNSLAALALGLEIGLDFKAIQKALASFSGVRRRIELKSRAKDILIFDDYAHHPTEIKATLTALKNFNARRILAVFQPHRYTRTQALINDFGACFSDVDQLVVTDIYPASELPIAGVHAKNICERARQAKVRDVYFLPKEDILGHLLKQIQPGDLVAVMGAGDIGGIADALAEEVKRLSAL